MVPYHRPIPERKRSGKSADTGESQQAEGGAAGMGGIVGAWIQAEKMIQIALVLPCATFIGWLIGAWLDHVLHQSWVAFVGIVVGIIAGLVGAIQMAMAYTPDSKQESKSGDGTEKGSSGGPP